jgi:curved DNA-binding protein CbpA
MEAKSFVDYYEILDASPSDSSDAIERRFRNLARRYHPDNMETGDRSRFDAVVEAHNTLRDVAKRAQYHQDHHHHLPPFSPSVADDGGPAEAEDDEAEEAALFSHNLGIDRDVHVQNNLLILLYLQRRRNIKEPGIGNAELERLSGCPTEHLEFHIWYLKEKGWIGRGEDGLLSITIDGVDRAATIYQESAKKLITDQS